MKRGYLSWANSFVFPARCPLCLRARLRKTRIKAKRRCPLEVTRHARSAVTPEGAAERDQAPTRSPARGNGVPRALLGPYGPLKRSPSGGPRAFPVHPLSLFSFPSGAHAHARTSFARLCSLFMDTPKFRNCRKGRRPLTLGILSGSDWRSFGLAQSLRPEQLLLVI